MKSAIAFALAVFLAWSGLNARAGEEAPAKPEAAAATKLAQAAKALAPGGSAAFDGPPKAVGNYGISWQGVTGFWDPTHREFQFMSKMQGGGVAKHWIYAEATGEWRETVGSVVWGGGTRGLPGHVWSRTFDATTGDYYYMDTVMSSDFLRVMTRATEAGEGSKNSPWTESSKPEFKARAGHTEEIGFHPNLYGPGDGGVILLGQSRVSAWRKKTNTWETVIEKCAEPAAGNGQYLPGHDRLVLGGAKGYFVLFDAGKDGKLATKELRKETAPLKVCGSTNGSLPWGKLVVDPANDKRLILLGPPPEYKVWTNAAGGTADGWVEEKYTHPFTKENVPMTGGDWGAWTCGSVTTHGVVWALAYDGKTSKGVLWMPNN